MELADTRQNTAIIRRIVRCYGVSHFCLRAGLILVGLEEAHTLRRSVRETLESLDWAHREPT